MTDRPKQTTLYSRHLSLGGRMVEFAGWEMPVLYRGVIEEHRAVRGAAGLFDVSHMGEVSVKGPGAEKFLQGLTPNDVSKLAPGRAHYSGLLNERGTYLDDILIYRLAAEDFLVVVNASNSDRDAAWIKNQAAGADAEVIDVSDQFALLALQGPKALEILTPLASEGIGALRYYGFQEGTVGGHRAIISRTGYTGEDGFELYLAPDAAPDVWDRLLAAGKDAGLLPAGLGARDTLRLEAAMALYGHELDETTTPLEAGLNWVVKLDKGEFLGRQALVDQQQKGLERKLVGLKVEGRGIAREGYPVHHQGAVVGTVTSGTMSPTLGHSIALAYVPPALSAEGTELAVEVRGREIPVRVVATPFYRRPKPASGKAGGI
jgi:aminomethyltransferase